LDFLDIAARDDPWVAHRRQPLLDISFKARVTPRPGTIINADRIVRLSGAASSFSRAQRNLPKRDAEIGMDTAGFVNFGGVWQRATVLSFDRCFACAHSCLSCWGFERRDRNRIPSPALP